MKRIGLVALAAALAAALVAREAYARPVCRQFPDAVELELEYVESIDGLPAFGSSTAHDLWLNDAGAQFNTDTALVGAHFENFEQSNIYEQPLETMTLLLSDGSAVVMELER